VVYSQCLPQHEFFCTWGVILTNSYKGNFENIWQPSLQASQVAVYPLFFKVHWLIYCWDLYSNWTLVSMFMSKAVVARGENGWEGIEFSSLVEHLAMLLWLILTLRGPACEYIIPRFRPKTSSFWLHYQRHSSSADCTRELFKGSNRSASLLVCT